MIRNIYRKSERKKRRKIDKYGEMVRFKDIQINLLLDK